MTDNANLVPFTFNGTEYYAKKKFKRLQFLRALDEGNLFGAFSLGLDEESLKTLLDLDLEEDEFEDLLEILSKAVLGGKDQKEAKGN